MPQNNFPWTGNEAPTWSDIQGKPTSFPPTAATTTAVGGVKVAAHVDPSTGTVAQVVAALIAAGIMSAS